VYNTGSVYDSVKNDDTKEERGVAGSRPAWYPTAWASISHPHFHCSYSTSFDYIQFLPHGLENVNALKVFKSTNSVKSWNILNSWFV